VKRETRCQQGERLPGWGTRQGVSGSAARVHMLTFLPPPLLLFEGRRTVRRCNGSLMAAAFAAIPSTTLITIIRRPPRPSFPCLLSYAPTVAAPRLAASRLTPPPPPPWLSPPQCGMLRLSACGGSRARETFFDDIAGQKATQPLLLRP